MRPEWKISVIEMRKQKESWKKITSLIWSKQKPSEWWAFGVDNWDGLKNYLKSTWQNWI